MSLVALALYRDGTQIGDRVINWWTRSAYSHCELLIDGVCYSSSLRDGGVRAKKINLRPKHWDVIELPWADAGKVCDYFLYTEGDAYNWLGLIRAQVFNRGEEKARAAFCSEWCATALGLPRPSSYSPDALRGMALWLNQFMVMRHD